jgi:hypothetical protein
MNWFYSQRFRNLIKILDINLLGLKLILKVGPV